MTVKAIASALITAAGLMTFASAAQARSIYWTGYQKTMACETEWSCRAQAAQYAEAGARQSCMDDFGIAYNTCMYAPISRTENLGMAYDSEGGEYCQMRVYIEVP